MKAKNFLRVMGAAVGLAAGLAAIGTAQAAEKYKIYLSMSYIGNDWQAEAANDVKALAASRDYRDKVDLRIKSRARMRSAKSSKSTPWCKRAPMPSWFIRFRRPP